MAEDNFNNLIQALKERDISYDRRALEKAYKDPESRLAIDVWIQEYLTPKTLLTKDEVALYATFSKTGEASQLGAQDLSQIQPLNDRELQIAIEELGRSTTSIEKQTETLKAQHNALHLLIKSERSTEDARSQAEEGQLRAWEAARRQTTKQVEELSQTISYQVTELEQQYKETQILIKQNVDGILKSDDKLLLSLQKLAADLEPVNSENTQALAQIQDLCARLIKHTVEGVRTRLDRVYLETLVHHSVENGTAGNSQEALDLQEELESLYAEILPVAQMSAEQQFLEPARKLVANTDGRAQERAAKAFDYINKCLVFLTDRLETLSRQTAACESHNIAVGYVIATAKDELSRPLPAPSFSSTSRSNKTQRRKSSLTQSPIKPRGLRRRSSGSTEGLEPEQQLARNLGLTLPGTADSNDSSEEVLERILSERIKKLEIHSESLQHSTENSISSHLHSAHEMLQILQDTLHSQSKYGTVQLLNPELVDSVNTFEQDIAYVKTTMEDIDLQVLHGKNVKRDQIVEKWQ